MARQRPNQIPLRIVRSAGAVVWRRATDTPGFASDSVLNADDIEVALIHRPRYHDWSWPKGKAEKGEHLLTCAVREVEEEIGVPVRLGAPLTTQRYRLGSGHTKEVHYWVGNVDLDAGALRVRRPVTRASSKEVDQVKWVSPARARRMLTRRGDRRILDDVVERLANGTLQTRTVAILRHAKALSRAEWDDGEGSRPLTRTGTAQATDLIPLLSALGIGRVITSPWRRCEATIGPYSLASSVLTETQECLTERAHTENPGAVTHLVKGMLNGALEAGPALVCTHRPLLPTVFNATLGIGDGASARGLPMQSPWLQTAQLLVLHITGSGADSRLVAWELHRPHGAD